MLMICGMQFLKLEKNINLMVIAPAHHRRIQAGILSWGQDMDHAT